MKIRGRKLCYCLLLEQNVKNRRYIDCLIDRWCLQSAVPLNIYRGRSGPVPRRLPTLIVGSEGQTHAENGLVAPDSIYSRTVCAYGWTVQSSGSVRPAVPRSTNSAQHFQKLLRC
jgi:hypothetical protein